MKTTVSIYDFRDAFQRMGRGQQFSYDGLQVLFDYLEDYEAGSGEEVELDVIGLCCDFSENDPEYIAEQYGVCMIGYDDNEEGLKLAVVDHLELNGAYIGTTTNGKIVYRQF
jgi:hypothetical protein